MKKETLRELKIRVFKREMDRVGYVSDNYSAKEIETMAMDAFKSVDGKTLKTFGTVGKIEDDRYILEKVKGHVRDRQREQIEQFRMFDEEDGIPPMTFGQQISAQSIKEAYGFDVFEFIKAKKIKNYNISAMEYEDPETGETKSLVGGL